MTLDAPRRPASLDDVETLIDMLEYRAVATPDQEAFLFGETSVSFAAMWADINRVASFLKARGIGPGDRVMIIFPNGVEFFAAFYGIQRAGGVSVPIFPGSGMKRALSIFTSCGAKAVIVPADTPAEIIETYRAGLKAFGAELFTFDQCLDGDPDDAFPRPEPDDLAFLQYTSGSTGESKGVMLTHANLVANLRQMIEASKMDERDVLVSWLPVYHDLGLILMTMAPFYAGARLILLPTSLTRMSNWLEAITRHKGTFTAAPDIGFRQALGQVRDPSKYDLSHLRLALNAAEPVRAETVRQFEERFGCPFAVKPGYGLAESSVGVSFWGLEKRPIKVDERGNVAIGYALPDLEMKIVSEEGELPTGEIGELVFKSPSGTQGYFRNPDATANLFWGDGWIRTGDLAYRDADGDLFMVARKKNVIKQSGRTLSPREIEELVDDFPEIRCSAAVGINRGNAAGEQVYVFAESRGKFEREGIEPADVVRRIVRAIHERLGFRPGRVHLVKKQTVPFTYNGKIRHAELKERYLSGRLAEEGLLIYPTS
ncbi:AMP-binding protein [Albimonas sp. CAU 1670]|uniref:AMP-binding protein n=1 Tax=Albimonas sp. CAU 1670 TaxID=3032599 RepID=UPI0023DBE7E0|nr:AMP-binding protein [Albimonas sp. CAU 1670]MDF2235335.1 AMP-binding protein [Albimonas sp. CAU 1670]